jgi:hypothetical protein
MKRISLYFGVALLFAAAEVHAAPIFVTAEAVLPGGLPVLQAARAGWATAHGAPLLTEGFESLAAAPTNPFDFGDFTLGFSGTGFTLYGANALTRTEGTQGLGFTGSGTVTFTFDSAINAFGIDWSSFDSPATVIAYSDDAGGAIADVFVPVTIAGAGFLGVRNTVGFTTVSFAVTSGEILEFDNIQYGAAAVPEPVTLALFGLAAAGYAGHRRRSATKRNRI